MKLSDQKINKLRAKSSQKQAKWEKTRQDARKIFSGKGPSHGQRQNLLSKIIGRQFGPYWTAKSEIQGTRLRAARIIKHPKDLGGEFIPSITTFIVKDR